MYYFCGKFWDISAEMWIRCGSTTAKQSSSGNQTQKAKSMRSAKCEGLHIPEKQSEFCWLTTCNVMLIQGGDYTNIWEPPDDSVWIADQRYALTSGQISNLWVHPWSRPPADLSPTDSPSWRWTSVVVILTVMIISLQLWTAFDWSMTMACPEKRSQCCTISVWKLKKK